MGETSEKKGFFRRLVEGLTKTRKNIVSGIDAIFGGFSSIDEDFYEEIEEILIMGDLGVNATQAILDDLRSKVQEQGIKKPEQCKELLIESIRDQMNTAEADFAFEEQRSVVLIIGVNGVGKTTTIGKLASKYHNQGKKVVLAAADTFRAAAGEQLEEWARRAGVDIISAQEGSDPGAVVFDAINAAKARKADILLVDTAGRLHNKKNLMNELGKINRIIDSAWPEVYRETLVVLDATTGQNALSQARQFFEVAKITGIILTKMDGSAKGGIAVAIHSELGIPVKYIGVGEKVEDLQRFDANDFVNALFDIEPEPDEDAYSTQELAADEDAYSTQELAADEDAYSAQELAAGEDAYSTQEMAANEDAYTAQELASGEDACSTQELAAGEDVHSMQECAPDEDVRLAQDIDPGQVPLAQETGMGRGPSASEAGPEKAAQVTEACSQEGSPAQEAGLEGAASASETGPEEGHASEEDRLKEEEIFHFHWGDEEEEEPEPEQKKKKGFFGLFS